MSTKTKIETASRLPEINGDIVSPVRGAAIVKTVDLDVHKLQLKIVGTSPLVVHAWSDKARTMMLDKQKGTASKGKARKDPVEDFKASLYRLPNNEGFGLPATAIKSAAVTAANDVELRKTDMRRAFHVVGDLVKIEAPPITEPYTQEDVEYAHLITFEHQHGASMRSDMVRVGMGTADVRFRAMFPIWEVVFVVDFNSRVISQSQLVNLFNVSGFGVGSANTAPKKTVPGAASKLLIMARRGMAGQVRQGRRGVARQDNTAGRPVKAYPNL